MQYFILGVSISAAIAMIICGILFEAPLEDCAKDHNVYKCEWVTKPITTED